MEELQQQQIQHLKELLDARETAVRMEILQDVDRQESFMDVASEAPDPGDASFATLTVDLGNAAVSRDMQELRAIQAALERMRNGSYGECIECGYSIPYERLEVQLTAERCAPCQAVYERTHMDALRGSSM